MIMKLSFNPWIICKWLLIICILISPIVGIYDTVDFYFGKDNTLAMGSGQFYVILRALRDVLIIIFYMYFLWCYVFYGKSQFDKEFNLENLVVFCLIGLAFLEILLSIFYSIILLGLPIIVIILGLKTFLYIPLYIIALIFFRDFPFAKTGIRKVLIFVIGFQLLLGVVQLLYFYPLSGVSIFGTSLPMGTFTHPNIYGAFLCMFLFAHLFIDDFELPNVLFLGVILLVFLSGSRAAILVMGFLLFLWLLKHVTSEMETRGIALSLAPFLLLALVLIAPLLSARKTFYGSLWLTADPRVMLWLDYFNRDLSLFQLALGSGVGLASNTVTLILGPKAFPGQFIADGAHLAFIAQYGFLGLIFMYLALLAFLAKYYRMIGIIYFILISLFGFGINFFEIYPANFFGPLLLAFHSKKYL